MSRPVAKWAYLLSHIGRPTLSPGPPDPEYEAMYDSWRNNPSLTSIGMTLRPVTIETMNMFAFTVRGGEADDSFAQRFADAVLATLTLLYGSTFDETPVALRVPFSLLRRKKLTSSTLLGKQAIKYDERPFDELSLRLTFGGCLYVPPDVLGRVWESLPVTIADPFYDAVHHYAASIREFCFQGDDIAEVLLDDPAYPVSRRDAVRAETAVHSAFKAVEALIGEPPRDDGKLRRKLEEIGVDPDELVGAQWFGRGPAKESVFVKVRNVHRVRDTRAAHAKTPNRSLLRYYEVMDCQGCARAVLVRAIQHQLENSKAGVVTP